VSHKFFLYIFLSVIFNAILCELIFKSLLPEKVTAMRRARESNH